MSSPETICTLDHLTALEDLARLRGRPALLYATSGSLTPDTGSTLYACLRQLGPQDTLDLVLQCPGGDPAQARRLAVLLRTFTRQLSILVLEYASSAATLLCLAADELILSPLACLSPIDPQVLSAPPESLNRKLPEAKRAGPASISTEDVRVFGEVAREWFGIGESAQENVELLRMLVSHIFPTTLTTFYRADQEMRQAADELLRTHQLEEARRQHICEQLVRGFSSHQHLIHRQEARDIGLPVREATREEEDCLWRLQNWTQTYLGSTIEDHEIPGTMLAIRAVLAGQGFAFHNVLSLDPSMPATDQETTGPKPVSPVAAPSAPRQLRRSGWRQVFPDPSRARTRVLATGRD